MIVKNKKEIAVQAIDEKNDIVQPLFYKSVKVNREKKKRKKKRSRERKTAQVSSSCAAFKGNFPSESAVRQLICFALSSWYVYTLPCFLRCFKCFSAKIKLL